MRIVNLVHAGPRGKTDPVADAEHICGTTLCRPGEEADRSAHAVRLQLVRRPGPVAGWIYNVRETRAEDECDERPPSAGRLISSRWVDRQAAEELLELRRQTLIAMGYSGERSDDTERGPWVWLRELASREHAREHLYNAGDPGPATLEHALSGLGMSGPQVLAGIAEVLELDVEGLRHPNAEVAARVDPIMLRVILGPMLRHPSEAVRAVADAWLSVPSVLFQVAPALLERWLDRDDALARRLAQTLRTHGLALLGPEKLVSLSLNSACPAVREAADSWVRRLARPSTS